MRQFLPPPKRWGYPCCKLIDETWEIDGKVKHIQRCRICIEKGRNLFEEK